MHEQRKSQIPHSVGVWIGVSSLVVTVSLFLPWFIVNNGYNDDYINIFSARALVGVLLLLIVGSIDTMFVLARYQVTGPTSELHPILIRAAAGASGLGTVIVIYGLAASVSNPVYAIIARLSFGGFVALAGNLVLTILLGRAATQTLHERRSSLKVCPDCAETVKLAALKCRHCGYQFRPDEAPPTPEAG